MKFLWYILIFLAGCAKIPESALRGKIQTEIPLAWNTKSSLFPEGDFPSENWWEIFKDENLNSFIASAFDKNPSLRSAEEKIVLMQEMTKQKFSFLLPSLNFLGFNDYQHLSKFGIDRFPPSAIPAIINQIDLLLNFHYEFDFWGKNRNAFKAALSEEKMQAAETAQIKIVLSISLARAFFGLKYHLQRLTLLKELLQKKEEFTRLTESRFTFALDNAINVSKAKEELIAFKETIAKEEKDIQLNKHLLGVLMGIGPDASFEISSSDFPSIDTFPLPSNLPLDLLSRRADIMAKLWSVEAAAYEIGSAKALFYPNIDLSAVAGIDTLRASKLFSFESFTGSLKPAIRLPIFTGGRLRANLRAKVADFETKVFDYNSLILQSAQEVADSLTSFTEITIENNLQNARLQEAENQYALSSKRFLYRIDNLLTLLESEMHYLTQKMHQIDMRFSKILSALALIKAIGGGYQMPFNGQGECKKYGG